MVPWSNLDETVTREEVVVDLCIALGKPDLGDQCRLYKRFGGVQTVVVRLTEAFVRSFLGLGGLRVGWVNCRIREHVEVARCFRCQGCGHVSRGFALPGRNDVCWRCRDASHETKECKPPLRFLTYADRGKKDVLFCSPDFSIRDFLEADTGFVWVEVVGVRVYICIFSPNDPFEIFENQILFLEESLREDSGRSLIAGNFNSKLPEWREACVWTGGGSSSARWSLRMTWLYWIGAGILHLDE